MKADTKLTVRSHTWGGLPLCHRFQALRCQGSYRTELLPSLTVTSQHWGWKPKSLCWQLDLSRVLCSMVDTRFRIWLLTVCFSNCKIILIRNELPWNKIWENLPQWLSPQKIGNFCSSLCPYWGLFNHIWSLLVISSEASHNMQQKNEKKYLHSLSNQIQTFLNFELEFLKMSRKLEELFT